MTKTQKILYFVGLCNVIIFFNDLARQLAKKSTRTYLKKQWDKVEADTRPDA